MPKEVLASVLDEIVTSSQKEEKSSNILVEQAVHSHVMTHSLDVEQLVPNIFRAQDTCPLSPPSSQQELPEFSLGSFRDSGLIVD